jgi:phenylalanyl-tRNA synthetase beta chain
VRPTQQKLLDERRSGELTVALAGESLLLGYLGEVTGAALDQFDLRSSSTVAELRLTALDKIAELVPQYSQPPVFPAVTRDLNLVVDDRIEWADVARTVRDVAGEFAEDLRFQDVYRDRERLGAGKKSLLFTLTLRSSAGTLTNEEADQIRARVVEACQSAHAAQLRA